MQRTSSNWLLQTTFLAVFSVTAPAAAESSDPDTRARLIEAQMNDAERIRLLHFPMPIYTGPRPSDVPDSVKATAGWLPGQPKYGIPDLYFTDASLGVVNPLGLRKDDVATALPSGLSLAASFNPDLARRAGEMIASEARAKGFHVLLAGGVNLTRDWYGGRNFEYLGEDPLLAGIMGGAMISGIQSQRVASTVKHFVLNPQETQRRSVDALIDEAALRESDLLAFQIAIEIGRPASVMCAYNLVLGSPSCGNSWLLNKVLKKEWGYKGWVMSDWGTTHEADFFNKGLDQQAGENLDQKIWFGEPLKEDLIGGRVSRNRLSDGVQRIIRSIFAVGADTPRVEVPIDYAANAQVAREAATRGIVLLKNDGILPLNASGKRVLVVGSHADRGVLSGGGSSNVIPVGGAAAVVPMGGPGFLATFGRMIIHPSSPLAALKAAYPDAKFEFDNGYFQESAAARASNADVVIVFAGQWQTESLDNTTLALPHGQDDLIEKIAAANLNTIVVLETGNPLTMPWLRSVRGVVQAWYSGQRGGEAIADVLSGATNPSGRLPMTFPQKVADAPRPEIPGLGLTDRTPVTVNYHEGSNVGYRWYAKNGTAPLFPFGFGLSYTSFAYEDLRIRSGREIEAQIVVRNTGDRVGLDTPQLYLLTQAGKPVLRLAGFTQVNLEPGESRTITIKVDPRLIASWKNGWMIDSGTYEFAVGSSAGKIGKAVSVKLARKMWQP